LSPELEQNVLSAAKLTAEATFSPPPLQKQRDKVFRACAAPRMNDRLVKRLRTLITKDPSLLHARATHLGDLAPDGLTPLQTAAYTGSMQAIEIILELGESIEIIQEQALLIETDLKGRTALHVAADRGHVDIVQKLLPLYQVRPAKTGGQATSSGLLSSPMPVDLLGRTPFGTAMTSPNPTARKNKKELEKSLFSTTDLSVFGVGRPEMERVGHDTGLRVTYGTSDMPGRRVVMEDALCACRFQVDHQAYLLLGVCDGHGDHGLVSDFVATTVPRVLQEQLNQLVDGTPDWPTIWKTTCLQVDEQLKDKGDIGGSTAVFVLVTEDLLVVANVGDSRIILIQQGVTGDLESAVEQLSLSEEKESAPDQITKAATSSTVVVPLSEDHKPNLPEEQARVEAAGMTVAEFSFEEDGKTITIPKVCKSEGDMLAVSRSFGDFEYKANVTLGPEEQAIVCLPEVRVHRRSIADLYLALACDGIWDVCSNNMVKDFVVDQVKRRKDVSETVLPQVGDALLLESLNLGSQDNMTVILVALGGAAEALQTVGKTLDFDDA
jgi:serine/threonine protein phosphatase PrpC